MHHWKITDELTNLKKCYVHHKKNGEEGYGSIYEEMTGGEDA